MTGKRNYRELEHLNTQGTKKYRQRLIQEEEAEQMIREHEDIDEEESVEDDDNINPNKN